ncbi:MAG TPA: glutathione S-transferase [Kofleriaceae bacterium]|nr:glutathione S-transferase [Kofleriaceae bacterium]
MIYELFYWPGIQGRGEFVRLVLEDASADYVDVARHPGGVKRMQAIMKGDGGAPLVPLAPPFLRAGELWVAQTAAITAFLGERLGLAPADEQGRLTARTVAMTIADLVAEAHDTHHPVAPEKYHEEQKDEAKRRSESFRTARMPKFLGYLERVLERNGGDVLVGREVSYVDLAAFQVVEGLGYAFPRALAHLRDDLPRLLALRDRIAARPRVAAYLASERRLPFNTQGIFRHYPELDG